MSSPTDFDGPKSNDGRSAQAFLACPYCNKRRFESVRALNRHISKLHDGDPFVSAISVLCLVSDHALSSALLPALHHRSLSSSK